MSKSSSTSLKIEQTKKEVTGDSEKELYELYRLESANPKGRGEILLKNAHINKVSLHFNYFL